MYNCDYSNVLIANTLYFPCLYVKLKSKKSYTKNNTGRYYKYVTLISNNKHTYIASLFSSSKMVPSVPSQVLPLEAAFHPSLEVHHPSSVVLPLDHGDPSGPLVHPSLVVHPSYLEAP